MAIVIVIILVVFMIQKFGTASIGRLFGPVMLIWFSFLGIAGLLHMTSHLEILKALSPVYAIRTLFSPDNKVGIFLLGSIFLATTGLKRCIRIWGMSAKVIFTALGHLFTQCSCSTTSAKGHGC